VPIAKFTLAPASSSGSYVPGGVSNVLQRHVRPHLVGPSKRDRGPRGELKGCGLSAAVRRLQTGQLSNVRPGRHIDRYRIAHSGGQTIILMGREEIAVVIFNVSRVEHPVVEGYHRRSGCRFSEPRITAWT
jgi:hypothetical protein